MFLMDTAGQKDFDNIRQLAYPDTQIFFICFDLNTPTTLENAMGIWKADLEDKKEKLGLKSFRIFLIGTQCDKLGDKPHECKYNNKLMDEEYAKELGFTEFIETSAFTSHNVKKAFLKANKIGKILLSQ